MKEIKLILPDGYDDMISLTAVGHTGTQINVNATAMTIEDNATYNIKTKDMEGK